MKTVAIIQARMGSTRLPGKVLMDLGGRSALARVVRRVRRCSRVDEVVVATTCSRADDAIVRECEALDVKALRGSEDDVLDRYYRAAREFVAEIVVRITADCPLIAPDVVDQTIAALVNESADYASNVFPRTYPRGLDVEAFTMNALSQAWREADQGYQREHVTPYFYEHPEIFRSTSVRNRHDYNQYRWTLDTADDLALLRAIYDRLGNRDDFDWREAIEVMQSEPELSTINAHVRQKALYAIG